MKPSRPTISASVMLTLALGVLCADCGRAVPVAGQSVGAIPAGTAAEPLPDADGAVGPATGVAAVTGSVAGTQLALASTLVAATKDAQGGAALLLQLSDVADACALDQAKVNRQGSVTLLVALGAGGAVVGAGTYTVGDTGHEAVAQLYHLDANCVDALGATAARATGGTVILDPPAADGSIAGHLHLTFGTAAEALSATFAATPCAALGSLIDPSTGTSTATTCK